MPSTTAPGALSAAPSFEPDEHLDDFVARARAASDQFRAIDDQATVDLGPMPYAMSAAL